MFLLLSRFINNPGLFTAFKLQHTSIYASLFFFAFLYTPISLILSIAGKALSRRYEFEADSYAARIRQLLAWLAAGSARQPDLSIKLSALTPRFDPIDLDGRVERVLARLKPICDAAARAGVSLTLDMESHDSRPLALAVFTKLAQGPGIPPGLALQADRPDAEADLHDLLSLRPSTSSTSRRAHAGACPCAAGKRRIRCTRSTIWALQSVPA